MAIQQAGSNVLEVLDRVLDKGIVIDAWVRVTVVGIDLVTVAARVVVASAVEDALSDRGIRVHRVPLTAEELRRRLAEGPRRTA